MSLIKNRYISDICEKLKQDDFKFKDEKFDHFDSIVASGQQFKISWFKTTQVNIFVIMGVADRVTKEFIEAYSRITLSYSIKNNEVFPKQMRCVTASFPLLISSSIDDDARQWVKVRLKKQLGYLEIPIILDSGNNTLLYHDEKSSRSSGYYKFLDGLIQKYFNTF
ncbi:MAG: hypothetical protein ACUZ8I_13795 [Candidatus Scalindua sp.]